MNLFKKRLSLGKTNDTNLVMNSLGGDRDAFCHIVDRYQNLLCSIAYAAIGDIRLSEDIAQETFVEAWKKLDTLHDPVKLKSWLCGILRFKVSHYRRKEKTQPIQGADELEKQPLAGNEHLESSALDDEAIKQQQQSLMWRVLDEIDEIYREPLVLYYREQQSIERVASELDLTTDTVKQRLSRGRKLLKQAMSSFVEEGLKTSKPGAAFTAGVMAIVSSIAPPAKAAAFGAGTAKTWSSFNLATLLAFLGSISGLISSYFGLQSALNQSRTERERKLAKKVVVLFLGFAAIYVAGVFGTIFLAHLETSLATPLAIISQCLVIGFVLSYFYLVKKMFSAIQNLRARERIFEPEAFARDVDQDASKREYKSKFSLFGVPFIHMQFGMPEKDDKPAFGWIAGGSIAHGLLFAWGGVSIAPIAVGIISVGFVSVGAIGLGVLTVGAVAIGVLGFGSSAIAYKAYASLTSVGWESAFSNGFSIAVDSAIAPFAYAQHINNDIAAQTMNLSAFGASYQWILAAVAFFVIVPAAWHASKVKKRMS